MTKQKPPLEQLYWRLDTQNHYPNIEEQPHNLRNQHRRLLQLPPPMLGTSESVNQRIGTLGRLEKIVTRISLLDSSSGRECFVIPRVTKIRHNRNDRTDSRLLATVSTRIFAKGRTYLISPDI